MIFNKYWDFYIFKIRFIVNWSTKYFAEKDIVYVGIYDITGIWFVLPFFVDMNKKIWGWVCVFMPAYHFWSKCKFLLVEVVRMKLFEAPLTSVWRWADTHPSYCSTSLSVVKVGFRWGLQSARAHWWTGRDITRVASHWLISGLTWCNFPAVLLWWWV